MQTTRVDFDLPTGDKKLDRFFSDAEKWIEFDHDDNGMMTRLAFFARHPEHPSCTATMETHLTIVSRGKGTAKSVGKVTRTIADDSLTPPGAIAQLARFINRGFDMAKKRRGGPIPTPEEEKLTTVRKWLTVKGSVNQEAFALSEGITPQTLRKWKKELENKGKIL